MRSLLEEFEVFDRVGSCKENVRRNVRYLIELRVVRSLLEGFRGIRLSMSSLLEVFRGIRLLGVVRRMLGECKVSD